MSRFIIPIMFIITVITGCTSSGGQGGEVDDATNSVRTFTYKTVDGYPIQADVYDAPGEGLKPAILWLHGGGLITGSRRVPGWPDPDQLAAYLDAGFTAVVIDYRLAPETKLPGIISDLEDAYVWMRSEAGRSQLQIDPERIAVVGHSAGGYLTLVAGYILNPRPQALVSFYGYGDITGAWLSEPSSAHLQTPPLASSVVHEIPHNGFGSSV